MSHIDTINHSFFGLICGIPVYHPLENDSEYKLTTRSIIIGGGSGEHEIFALNDINSCVKAFILYHMDEIDFQYCNDEKEFTSYWSIEDCYHFFLEAKENMETLEINNAERYIVLSIAEYLLFNGEHLIGPELCAKAKSLVEKPYINAIKKMNNDIDEPTFGRTIKDGRVKWGYTLENEKLEVQNVSL